MRVTMLQDKTVTVDGVNTIDAAAGDTHEMGDGVAQSLIDSGHAAPADEAPNTAPAKKRGRRNKADEQAPGNKDAGDADETTAGGDEDEAGEGEAQ